MGVVSESLKLLNCIYFNQSVVKRHDGPAVTQSVIDELDSWDNQEDQGEGGSFDGQYFHLRFPVYLTEAFHLLDQFLYTWDLLHKGYVVDNQIVKDSRFPLLVEIQNICWEIFSTFNWGKTCKKNLKSCEDLNIKMKKLTNF